MVGGWVWGARSPPVKGIKFKMEDRLKLQTAVSRVWGLCSQDVKTSAQFSLPNLKIEAM